MRRTRVVAAVVFVAGGLLVLALSSAGRPAPASAAAAPPSVITGPPSNVGESNATVNGMVNPNGQSTHYYFRYGTTVAYGVQTTPANAGTGSTPVAVNRTLFGLSANTTYHYQLVAQSPAGTSTGLDQTLTTTSTPTSQTVVLGHEGFVSPGWIVGAEVGCFHGQTPCAGHLSMSHDGTVIAERDYSIAANSGGFQNMALNPTGQRALGSNSAFHLLPVTITATQTGGPTASWVIHLARWVWH
jgi:hypothetical protein